MYNELTMDELTARFYAVKSQRDKLMHALKVYRDAYGNCGSPAQQEAADKARDVLIECLNDRSWEDVADSGGVPMAT